MKVVVQYWEESERGWGTRPDGISVHLTDNDRQLYIQNYWRKMPDSIPDEYSRPIEGKVKHVDCLDLSLLAELETCKGARFWQHHVKELPWLTSSQTS